MMSDPHEITYLNPEQVSFSRNAGGVFQGVISGVSCEEVLVYRTFPFTYTSKYISIRNAKAEEIGIILDVEQLDPESREEMEIELRLRYLIPEITRIINIQHKSDMWLWELQTNLGPTRLTMRNLHEHMQLQAEGRILLTDMNGKRCEIRNLQALDAHSRKQLKDIV